MKFAIVFVALFALAYAAPGGSSDANAETLLFKSNVLPDVWSSVFETSNGIKGSEDGKAVDIGSDHESIVVHGSFSFVADDGQTYTVNYVADENGFQPEGAHIPKA